MILLICRISLGLLLGGTAFYFFANMEYFTDLQPDLMREKEDLARIQHAHFKEFNGTDDEIGALLRERSKLRQNEEEIIEKIEFIESERSFLEPKVKQLEENLSKAEEEAKSAELKVSVVSDELTSEQSKFEPFDNRKSDLEDELQKARLLLDEVNEQRKDLEDNFSSLSNVRAIAQKTFLSSKELLLSDIILPSFLFYDDHIGVSVENVNLSKTGFFIREGQEVGIKSDFLFIASEEDDFTDEVFRVRCKYSKENLSFFEFEGMNGNHENPDLTEGQKLYLIRTGDFHIDDVISPPAETDYPSN